MVERPISVAGTKLELLPEWFHPSDGLDSCIACSEPRYAPAYETVRFGYPLRFHRCACGVVKQVPMPTEEFLSWFFNSELFLESRSEIWGYDDYLRDEAHRVRTARLRYRRLAGLLSSGPQRLLKIGPSTGAFLSLARDAGHDVRGVDVSATFARIAEERHELRVDVGRFERQGYPSDHFDVVLTFNVVENVPNLDEFMGELRRVIRPGGHLVVNYVDMHRNLVAAVQKSNYFLVRPPICYMFARGAFARLLAKHGFSITRTLRDWRFLSPNKISGLLRWWFLRKVLAPPVGNVSFPVYAYPSRILVCRRQP